MNHPRSTYLIQKGSYIAYIARDDFYNTTCTTRDTIPISVQRRFHSTCTITHRLVPPCLIWNELRATQGELYNVPLTLPDYLRKLHTRRNQWTFPISWKQSVKENKNIAVSLGNLIARRNDSRRSIARIYRHGSTNTTCPDNPIGSGISQTSTSFPIIIRFAPGKQ